MDVQGQNYGKNGVFCAISSLSDFEGVSMLVPSSPRLHNSVSIYRKIF